MPNLLIHYSDDYQSEIKHILQSLRLDGHTLIKHRLSVTGTLITACIWFVSPSSINKKIIAEVAQTHHIGIPIIPVILGNANLKQIPHVLLEHPIRINRLDEIDVAIDKLKARIREFDLAPNTFAKPNQRSRAGLGLFAGTVFMLIACVSVLFLLGKSTPNLPEKFKTPINTASLTQVTLTSVAVLPTKTLSPTTTYTPTAEDSSTPLPTHTSRPSSTITSSATITETHLPTSTQITTSDVRNQNSGTEVGPVSTVSSSLVTSQGDAYYCNGSSSVNIRISTSNLQPVSRSWDGQWVKINSSMCFGCWMSISNFLPSAVANIPLENRPNCGNPPTLVPQITYTLSIVSIPTAPIPSPAKTTEPTTCNVTTLIQNVTSTYKIVPFIPDGRKYYAIASSDPSFDPKKQDHYLYYFLPSNPSDPASHWNQFDGDMGGDHVGHTTCTLPKS